MSDVLFRQQKKTEENPSKPELKPTITVKGRIIAQKGKIYCSHVPGYIL